MSLSVSMKLFRFRRWQGMCALFLCVSVVLHLLVAVLVLSIYLSTCEPSQCHVSQPHPNFTTADVANSVGQRNPVRANDLSKLEVLFSHPLYNLHAPPSPDEDWLLKVRNKGTEEQNAEQW